MPAENPSMPPADAASIDPNDRDYLRRIAISQRQINLTILCYFCLIPVNLGLAWVNKQYPPWGAISSLIILICLFVFGATAVYRLATLFRGRTLAVLYVIALPIPLLGLIPLITLSNEATTKLKTHGIEVGMLGANADEI